MGAENVKKSALSVAIIAIALSLLSVTVVAFTCFRLASQNSKLSISMSNLEKICNEEVSHIEENVDELKNKFTKLDKRMENIEVGIENLSKNIQDNFDKILKRLPGSKE